LPNERSPDVETPIRARRLPGGRLAGLRQPGGWKSPNPNTIYVRVGVSRIYELDLSSGSNQLQEPAMHLVSQIRGSEWICDPLDLQLQIVDDHDAFQEPLIVKSITRLTPDQIAAIPKKYLP
jgi:hypothetical protein